MLERVINMDISDFMGWFFDQVVTIFSFVYNTLDSITFFNTSLLKVSVTILIFSALIPVLFTIATTHRVNGSKSERVKKGNSNEEKD